MKSKRVLFEDLQDIAGLDYTPTLKSPGISDETYGRKSMIYINWSKFGINRKLGERALRRLDHKVNASYWPESQTSEVEVSYFKGWHWDE